MFGLVSSVLAEKGRQVYTISKGATVAEAVREMNEKGVGALLVMDGRRPSGIFTERDVLRRIVDADQDPVDVRVGAVMTAHPMTIRSNCRIDEAMSLMTEQRFRHLPVVDDGEVVGMLSSGDLMRWITLNQEAYIQQLTDYVTGRA
jgi:CBS domain-containing protein